MLTPLNPAQWDFSKAAHLLNRAGFGGTPEQIEAVRQAGFPNAIEALLDAPDDLLAFPKPAWAAPKNLAEEHGATMLMAPEQQKEKKKEAQKARAEGTGGAGDVVAEPDARHAEPGCARR